MGRLPAKFNNKNFSVIEHAKAIKQLLKLHYKKFSKGLWD